MVSQEKKKDNELPLNNPNVAKINIHWALSRFKWRIQQNKPFKFNDKDLEAYNMFTEYCTIKEKQQLIDNQHFGKLYIFLIDCFITYYGTTVDSNIPQKELHKILNTPGKQLVQKFTENRNLEALEMNIELKKNEEDLKPMEIEEASTNLAAMINAAINSFNQ